MRVLMSILIFLAVCLQYVQPAKIAVIALMGSKSHQQNLQPILVELSKRGHEVTMFTNQKPKGDEPFKSVFFENVKERLEDFAEHAHKEKGLKFVINLTNVLTGLCEYTLAQHPKSQEAFFGDNRYDAIIIAEFMSECFNPLRRRWNATTIIWSAGPPLMHDMTIMGNPFPWSTEVSPMLEMPERPMAFTERATNTIVSSIQHLVYWHYLIPKINEIVQRHYTDNEDFPEVLYETSLNLVMQHFSTSHTKAFLPSVVELGCISCSLPARPLPKELEEFVAGAGDNGFVFFSFGTMASGPVFRHFTQEDFKVLFSRFERMPQRFLVKLDRSDLPKIPANVFVGDWFPQRDILGHPKIRLFITHGGLNSQLEAYFYGVPMIGCPVFGDQMPNVHRMVQSGIGEKIDLADLNTEQLYDVMKKVIDEPGYLTRARVLARRAQDRPMTPTDTAAFWIEYVIRHDGAEHLRPYGHRLNFFQYFLLDVLGAFALVLFIFLYLLRLLCRCICCCGRSKKTKSD